MTWDLNTLSQLTRFTGDNNNLLWKGGEVDC